MKLVLATVSALTLMSVGTANAAIASYNFENGELNAVNLGGVTVNFNGGLVALGVTSSTITGAGAPSVSNVQGVYTNGLNNSGAPVIGANTTVNYGLKSFAIGNSGTWNLLFGSGITQFDFAYNETESSGFTVTYYALNGTTVLSSQTVTPNGVGGANALSQCQFASTCAAVNFTNGAGIGRVTIADIGGDNVAIDNLTVNTIDVSGVPEPSTYMMVGSALAAMAAFRRRRA
jgi:PEP-CTERM motif